jgi:hypothetical protein
MMIAGQLQAEYAAIKNVANFFSAKAALAERSAHLSLAAVVSERESR